MSPLLLGRIYSSLSLSLSFSISRSQHKLFHSVSDLQASILWTKGWYCTMHCIVYNANTMHPSCNRARLTWINTWSRIHTHSLLFSLKIYCFLFVLLPDHCSHFPTIQKQIHSSPCSDRMLKCEICTQQWSYFVDTLHCGWWTKSTARYILSL